MSERLTTSNIQFHSIAIAIVFAAFCASSVAHSAVRCEWLFAGERDYQGDKIDVGVIPEEGRGEKTAAWIKDSFWDIVAHFPFSSQGHAARFHAIDQGLTKAKFKRGDVVVRENQRGTYEAKVQYDISNPKIANQNYTIEIKYYLMKGESGVERNGGPVLYEQNLELEIIGFTRSNTNLVRRTQDRERRWQDHLTKFKQAGNRFDPRQRQDWIDHMRTVMHTVLVPLAMADQGISEVGIGFDPNANIDAKGNYDRLPELTISRFRGRYRDAYMGEYLYRASDMSWYLLASGRPFLPLLDKVRPVENFDGDKNLETVQIPNRDKYLIVFDEMLDQNPGGNIEAVDRETGERHQLYYHPSLHKWTFNKPSAQEILAAKAAPNFNRAKLNLRLADRVAEFDRSGQNPRVRVVIQKFSTGSQHVESILSVRAIRDLSGNPDVVSIVERSY